MWQFDSIKVWSGSGSGGREGNMGRVERCQSCNTIHISINGSRSLRVVSDCYCQTHTTSSPIFIHIHTVQKKKNQSRWRCESGGPYMSKKQSRMGRRENRIVHVNADHGLWFSIKASHDPFLRIMETHHLVVTPNEGDMRRLAATLRGRRVDKGKRTMQALSQTATQARLGVWM